MSETHRNLLAEAAPQTRMPEDPAAAELSAEGGRERFGEIVRANPTSSLCWALLAEGALAMSSPEGDIAAYAYARTGYHRGLDTLRRSGWKGAGQVPWEHAPNRGFLRALWALAVAAKRIGEGDENERCTQLLRDSSEAGWRALSGETADPNRTPNPAIDLGGEAAPTRVGPQGEIDPPEEDDSADGASRPASPASPSRGSSAPKSTPRSQLLNPGKTVQAAAEQQ